MVKTFNREDQSWRDENGDFASPPPDALNKKFDPNTDSWRYVEGHPNAGAFAPSPEPDITPWSHRDDEERFIKKDTDEVVTKSRVESFKESLPDSLNKEERENRVKNEFSPAWVNPEDDSVMKQSHAINRNRNLERAQIFKNWAEQTDLSYQFFQQKFKGIPTEDIRGEFIAIDPESGKVEYGEPSDRVNAILMDIAEEHGHDHKR